MVFKPWHSLVFAAVIFLLLGTLSFFIPENGFVIGRTTIKFPQLSQLFRQTKPKKNIANILKAAEEAESANLADSIIPITEIDVRDSINRPRRKIKRDTSVALITSIQMASQSAMRNFFDALTSLQQNPNQTIRVLHYGDSQIEGDRITDQLRNKLQSEFGGSGPGLISLMPVSSSLINRLSVSGAQWDRYTAGTIIDKRVKHRSFGPMIGFARFLPYRTIADTTVARTATVQINTTRAGGKEVMNYQKIKLFYGGSKRKVWCEYWDGPLILAGDSLNAGGVFNVKEFQAGNGSYTHKLKFRGKDSPDFYAMSLESNYGIMVDNIALRGSSGTFFHNMDAAQLRSFYDYLNVRLIILQFGGNALPFIQNDTLVRSYSNWLRGQINYLKRLAPQASILFIGPADMSVKEGTAYNTHPFLEPLRDELKKMCFQNNCAYFDVYDCMGGYNSMLSWVEEKLAATDYIHFSPQGARKISALLHAALINAYNDYNETVN